MACPASVDCLLVSLYGLCAAWAGWLWTAGAAGQPAVAGGSARLPSVHWGRLVALCSLSASVANLCPLCRFYWKFRVSVAGSEGAGIKHGGACRRGSREGWARRPARSSGGSGFETPQMGEAARSPVCEAVTGM